MKLNKKNIEDLLILIQHTQKDVSFDSGGSYGYDDGKSPEYVFDVKEAESAVRAIKIIEKLVLENGQKKSDFQIEASREII